MSFSVFKVVSFLRLPEHYNVHKKKIENRKQIREYQHT